MEEVEVELVVIYVNTLQYVVLHNTQWLLVEVEAVEHTQQILYHIPLQVV
tara:strand:- start:278 stop:427 length:150 start_codon:yes stop_codon:yes gene_type:complete